MMTQATRADVLIVDDTPANLTVLSTILSREGHRVRPALSGELALRAAQKAPPDLVLLDIQMPGLDGFEVCRRLKADAATAHVPVIFISALEDALDKVEAFRAGGADYITKPFQIEEVLARVEHQIALRRQRAAMGQVSEGLDQIVALAERLVSADAAHSRALAAELAGRARELRAALGPGRAGGGDEGEAGTPAA
ncbi:MAG TPA: response regulator [Chloroflexaceae bacterium]|nr:response regulator [Chloroflexaceae bacterium]